jgi:hypothetical protein
MIKTFLHLIPLAVTRLLRLDLSHRLDFAVSDSELGDLAIHDDQAVACFRLGCGSGLGGAVDALG